MTRNNDLAERLEALAQVLRSLSAGVQWLAFDAAAQDDEDNTEPVHAVQVDGDGPAGPQNLATLVSRDFTSVDYIAADVSSDGASLTLEALGRAHGVSVRAVAAVRQPFAAPMLASLNISALGIQARADLTLSTLVSLSQTDPQSPAPVPVDVPATPGETPSDPQQGTGAQPAPSSTTTPSGSGSDPSTSGSPETSPVEPGGSSTPTPTDPAPSTSSEPQPPTSSPSQPDPAGGDAPSQPSDTGSPAAPSETPTTPTSPVTSMIPEPPQEAGAGTGSDQGGVVPQTGGASGGLVTDDGPSQAPSTLPVSQPDPDTSQLPPTGGDSTPADSAPSPSPSSESSTPPEQPAVPSPVSPDQVAIDNGQAIPPSDPQGEQAPPANQTETPATTSPEPATEAPSAPAGPPVDATGVQQEPQANGPVVSASDVTPPSGAQDPASSDSGQGATSETPAEQIARLQAQIASLQSQGDGSEGPAPTSVVTDDGPGQEAQPGTTNIASGQGAGPAGDPAGGGTDSSATTADL